MKFTKEVSVCIVAAALSVVSESSLDTTSTYMASSLKLKLSMTSDAKPGDYYTAEEATRNKSRAAKAFSSAVAGGAQLARSVERGATVAAVRAANAVITAADRYDKWESNRAQARINRNYNREVDRRIRKVQVTMGIRNAPREPWHKRNPHTAFILGVMSAVAVCGGVSFLIAVLIVAKGGPIIRPSLMEETGP